MLSKESGISIQAMPLGRGDAISPYTVLSGDNVVEFITEGTAICETETGVTTSTTVLVGSRYSIGLGVKTITFTGTFNIG